MQNLPKNASNRIYAIPPRQVLDFPRHPCYQQKLAARSLAGAYLVIFQKIYQ